MIEKTSKVIESLVKETIANAMVLRYDICTCALCRDEIFKIVTADVDIRQETTEGADNDDIYKQIKNKYQSSINISLQSAIDKVNDRPPHPVTEDRKRTFKLLIQLILQNRGVDFRNYHTELLKRRFALRIKANNLSSYGEYIKYLEHSPKEYEKLFDALCINVSEFFRDPPLWVTLNYLFEHVISNKLKTGEKTLKIWSAGCANGEEAYSLAIAASEALRSDAKLINIEIIATDIDKKCVETAQKGEYAQDSIKNVNDKQLIKYFIEIDKHSKLDNSKDKIYKVRENIRSLVEFSQMDLIAGNYPKDLDLMLCRNVFIYFDRHLQEKLLRKFYDVIKPGGYLCLGQSESMLLEVRKLFEDTDSNARIYKKS